MTADPLSSERGKRVGGRYRLVEVAGRGGMATVWRAEVEGARGFARDVAIKQMHPHLVDKPLYIEMFEEEARIGAAMADSNVAQVYDFIEEDGRFYIVLEWVDGIDLGSYIRFFQMTGGKTHWELVAAMGIGLLRGLAAAHERVTPDGTGAPIVHRDVSPHNVLISVKGKVKLIDFGLSLAQDRGRELTEPGIVKGKMAYMAPEIVQGERARPASDQWAAGCVLWESLVGRKLFDAPTDLEIYKKIMNQQVQPLRPFRPDVPQQLIAVIQRALQAEEDYRFASVREMASHLASVLKTQKGSQDLLDVMGRTVLQARTHLELGLRTSPLETGTPVADATPTPTPTYEENVEKKQGLRHRLPFLSRWRPGKKK